MEIECNASDRWFNVIWYEYSSTYYILKGGNPLLIGAYEVAAEYGRRLGRNATAEDFWKSLGKDEQFMLSVALNGWHRAKQTDAIEQSIVGLKHTSTSLRGNLSVVRYSVELLESIVYDAYSPLIFVTMLRLAPQKLMEGYELENDLAVLVNNLSSQLMSNSAAYFAARYLNSIKLIKDFIELFSYSVADLDDTNILSATRFKTKEIERMPLISDKVRTLLEKMEDYLPKESYQELASLVDKIQYSISKESAAEKLKTIHRERKLDQEDWDNLLEE